MTGVIDAAAAALGSLAVRDAPFGARTTYRVGGTAALLVEVADTAVLARVAAVTSETGIDVVVVGKGSNLLVADAGFDGLALVLGESFAEVTIDGTVVRAGGSAALPVVARRTVAAALTGWAGTRFATGATSTPEAATSTATAPDSTRPA